MHWLGDPQVWASFVTLTVLEIVLGIDNLVFLALIAGRLPARQQRRARQIGLALALGLRIGLLTTITWIMRLTAPLLSVGGLALSWRDLILIGGGLFLVYKGTTEIHDRLDGAAEAAAGGDGSTSLAGAVAQIALLDCVFSLDSVITAVGMASRLPVMLAAVVVSIGIMFVASGPVAGFVERHPTVKMLALSFLLLIGMTLIADGFGAEVPKGYVYAAIGFSGAVEALNQLAGRKRPKGRTRPRAG